MNELQQGIVAGLTVGMLLGWLYGMLIGYTTGRWFARIFARAEAWLVVSGGSEGFAAGSPVDAYMLRD